MAAHEMNRQLRPALAPIEGVAQVGVHEERVLVDRERYDGQAPVSEVVRLHDRHNAQESVRLRRRSTAVWHGRPALDVRRQAVPRPRFTATVEQASGDGAVCLRERGVGRTYSGATISHSAMTEVDGGTARSASW